MNIIELYMILLKHGISTTKDINGELFEGRIVFEIAFGKAIVRDIFKSC